MTSGSGRIHILPQVVTDKIAAGEVIERPASVIKELVENAIDAGADRIDITVNDGGFSMIKVVDNGCGMSGYDLARCTIRHATSKIKRIEDLFTIATLGFRGEALASIGSVSRMKVVSSTTEDGLGLELGCDGGILSEPVPASHTRGTSISCRDLFYNVPARKKFMKSVKAERMAVMRLMEQMVIPYPAIHFTVTCDGKRTLDVSRTQTTLMRIAQVAGSEFAKKLITCTAEAEGMDAILYVCAPHDATPRPRFQNLYVNLRRIDCDSITYGIREAFSRFITSHFKPAWFCFLDVDPHHIDVNVHPTKQKIKFDNEKKLFSFVFHMTEDGLNADMLRDIRTLETSPVHSATQVNERDNFSLIQDRKKPENNPSEKIIPAWGEKPAKMPAKEKNDQKGQTSLSFFSVLHSDLHSEKKDVAENGDKAVQLSKEQWDLIPCYQIHKMYILAPIKKGILLIDQHAAHERILYEQAIEDLKAGRAESQRLLFPIIIELTNTEKSVIMSGRNHFCSLGFDLQDFGGQSVAISAIPAAGFLKDSTVEEAVREMIQFLLEEKDESILSEPQKRYAAAFACGAAIKTGQALKQEEMNSLLNNLFAAQNPYICPHGRPTLVRISLDELSRRFLR